MFDKTIIRRILCLSETISLRRHEKMKILNLTVSEIKELQPADAAYAAEKGGILGGVEVAGEIDHDALAEKIRKDFGPAAEAYGEGMDGDDCVHYVVYSRRISQ